MATTRTAKAGLRLVHVAARHSRTKRSPAFAAGVANVMCNKRMNEEYFDAMRKHGDTQILVILSRAFIAGEGRNKNFVRSLESLFDQSLELHDDSQFEELGEAFAMYGASTQSYDDHMLTKALKKALPILEARL